MRILQRNLKRTTDTFLFISHTTNLLLFKFRCNIFIGFRIIKEMPGSVASGTLYITVNNYRGADKPLVRRGRKRATAAEDFDVHISYLLSYLDEY